MTDREQLARVPRDIGVSDFLHALVHDLKGPVSRVRMLGELLSRGPGSGPEADVLMRHLEVSAAAAENVLDGVGRYADAIALPFRPAAFELRAAVDAALLRVEARMLAAGARVECGPLPGLHGDFAQIALLFEELLLNALRFRSGEPLVVAITARRDWPGWWAVSVADNGIGLEAVDAARIFRPFAKGPERAGAGIGLAICSRIAALHAGEIDAHPLPQGAEFRLRLPGAQTRA